MIVYFILFSIVFSIMFIHGFISDHENYYDLLVIKVLRRISGVICGILVSIVLSMLLLLLGSLFQRGDYTKTVTHEIVSMGDGSGTDASFFLGCGYIEDNLVYNYYRKSENGGMVRRSISAEIATIYETDTLTVPRIVVHIVPVDNGGFWFPMNSNGGNQKYDIYLPVGSVIKDIKLDNQ